MRKSTTTAVKATTARDNWRATAGGAPRDVSAQPPRRNAQRVRLIVNAASAAMASTEAERTETFRGQGAWRAA
jgi:hypothetical protein